MEIITGLATSLGTELVSCNHNLTGALRKLSSGGS